MLGCAERTDVKAAAGVSEAGVLSNLDGRPSISMGAEALGVCE